MNRHAARLTAQLLAGDRVDTPEAVVGRLLAVQAQDARGLRLAIRPRSTGVRASDVDAALTDRRSLIVTWLNRGTLHLVAAEDYWWLHSLTTPPLATGNATRLRQEGVSPKDADKGVAVIQREVSTRGPLTRSELRGALDVAGVPTAGQALVHLLLAASLRGDLIRGPMRGSEQCFVAAADWLGAAPEALDRGEALGRLARRYLAGHGPASPNDLAKWAGVTLGDARRGLAAISDETVEGDEGLLDLAERPAPGPMPPPRLLGAFDPLLHGWVSREPVVGRHKGIVTTNGLFRPFAMVGGRAVATWGLDGMTLTIKPLEKIPKQVTASLDEESADVLRYLGLTPAGADRAHVSGPGDGKSSRR